MKIKILTAKTAEQLETLVNAYLLAEGDAIGMSYANTNKEYSIVLTHELN